MSLDSKTIDYMEGLLEDYFRQEKPFTSLDIANQTKKAGFFARNRWVAEWLRHNAIAIAHDMAALYNSTLIKVDSKADGITLAYLYHHMNDDPNNYLDRDQNPVSAPRQVHKSVPQTPNTTARDAFLGKVKPQTVVSVTVTNEDDDVEAPSPSVIKQHTVAVSDKTGSKQSVAVQRDIYGRFTKNPSAPVSKPTHFLKQKRDKHGRFIKD